MSSARVIVLSQLLWLVALAVAVVLILASGVAVEVLAVDRAVVSGLRELATGPVTRAVQAVTDAGGATVVLCVSALALVVLGASGQWRHAVALLVSVIATQAIVALVKGVVERPRPAGSDALVHAAGHGFPSGHAATAMALYGVLALIAHDLLPGRWRLVAGLMAMSLVGAIGLSRVYLGVHYPTDVLAGWMLGAVIAGCSWWLAVRLRRSPGRRALA